VPDSAELGREQVPVSLAVRRTALLSGDIEGGVNVWPDAIPPLANGVLRGCCASDVTIGRGPGRPARK
jgi:hypothetical protein